MKGQMFSFLLRNNSEETVVFQLFSKAHIPPGCVIESGKYRRSGDWKTVDYETSIENLFKPTRGTNCLLLITAIRKAVIQSGGVTKDLLVQPSAFFSSDRKEVLNIIWSVNPLQFQSDVVDVDVKMPLIEGCEFQVTVTPRSAIHLVFVASLIRESTTELEQIPHIGAKAN
jgi:hypothetical protein